MHAADITDEAAIQKDPHIVVAKEVILQRADIILGQLKLERILHAEQVVVIHPVVARGIILVAIVSVIPLLRFGITIRIMVAIRSGQPICTGVFIHRPEVIGPDMRIGCSVCYRIIEVLKTFNFCRVLTGYGTQRICIAHALEVERPAVINRLSLRCSVIKQVGCVDIVGVYDMPIGIEAGYQPEGATIETASVICIERVRCSLTIRPSFTA